MKRLVIPRVSLQLVSVAAYRLFFPETASPVLTALFIADCLYLAAVWLGFTGISESGKASGAACITDSVLSSSFVFFTGPALSFPFLAVFAFAAVVFRPCGWKLSLIPLCFISVSAAAFRIITGADAATGAVLLIPAVIASGFFLKDLYRKTEADRKDQAYFESLIDNKNKLLSTLTHELRTPLAVIKTSNELVLEERPGPLNDTQRSLINSSLENIRRLTSLVENILSQVKVEFAWFTMKKRVMDIRALIRKVAVDIRPFLETKKQSLHYNYPGLLSRTYADERWLQQVLLNLIHNASKHSPENSRLEISVKENEQCIVVSVHDCGMGIKNAEISSVFNEFYQSGDPSKDLTDGAGLGLTIVRDIIEKHNGKVYISSLPDAGTTVSFTLPIYKGVFSETFNSGH